MMHAQDHPGGPTPHLAPALMAVILGVVALTMFGVYARRLEARAIRALAADEAIIERDGPFAPVKNQGTALQRLSLRTDGLLLVYGSSELNVQAAYNRPFHATNLFRDYPSGFTVFPVGKAGTTCLVMLQELASLGAEVRGKKVAISLSPFWFFERPDLRPDAYAGNLSDLHAGELAFGSGLGRPLRREAARRMLEFPETLANRPLLRFALENLADGSPLSLACYDAVLPLGWLHNAILGYQDHWTVVAHLWTNPPKRPPAVPAGSRRPPDWTALQRQADALYGPLSDNNEFGLDNKKWDRELRDEMLRHRQTRSDAAFLDALRRNREWGDLELLLRGLDELGARPMLLSMPIHGRWYDRLGVSHDARSSYYRRLREMADRHGVPVVDFADHDDDRTFCHDTMGHLAPVGLVQYGRVLDAFYHDRLPREGELPAPAPVPRGRPSAAGR